MTVRALRRGSIAASRVVAGATPATYTIFSAASDGYIFGNPNANAVDSAVTNITIGQRLTSNSRYEGFLAFDTSVIPDGATITAVTLSLYGLADSSVTDFTIEVRVHDWGTVLELADWVEPASMGSKTLVATKTTASGWSTVGYNAFTSNGDFLTAINKTGFTRLLLNSDRHRLGTAPSGNEHVVAYSADQTGTTNDPKLVVDVLE